MPAAFETVAIPVEKEARMTCELDLFTRQVLGEPIGSLARIALSTRQRTLRDVMDFAAAVAVREWALEGFEPLEEMGDFKVFGPYRHKSFADGVKKARGHMEGEWDMSNTADFVLVAQCLATRAYPTEVATYDADEDGLS